MDYSIARRIPEGVSPWIYFAATNDIQGARSAGYLAATRVQKQRVLIEKAFLPPLPYQNALRSMGKPANPWKLRISVAPNNRGVVWDVMNSFGTWAHVDPDWVEGTYNVATFPLVSPVLATMEHATPLSPVGMAVTAARPVAAVSNELNEAAKKGAERIYTELKELVEKTPNFKELVKTAGTVWAWGQILGLVAAGVIAYYWLKGKRT